MPKSRSPMTWWVRVQLTEVRVFRKDGPLGTEGDSFEREATQIRHIQSTLLGNLGDI